MRVCASWLARAYPVWTRMARAWVVAVLNAAMRMAGVISFVWMSRTCCPGLTWPSGQDSGHSALVLVRSGPGLDLVAQDEVGARVERVCGGEVLTQLGDSGGGASGW